jgi:transglutaminase/protease-like cytokinesis protein 3
MSLLSVGKAVFTFLLTYNTSPTRNLRGVSETISLQDQTKIEPHSNSSYPFNYSDVISLQNLNHTRLVGLEPLPLTFDNKSNFINAVSEGNIDLVESRISENVKYLDVTNSKGFSPLHIACKEGQKDMVKLLLDRGHRLYPEKAESIPTPYKITSQNNSNDILQLLCLQSTERCPSDDSKIKVLANRIIEGASSDRQKIHAIHNYLIIHLKDIPEVSSKRYILKPTGKKVLLGPMHGGVCHEWTIAFITLSRAAGIPARAIINQPETRGKSSHVWAEAWVENDWKIVDAYWDSHYHKAGVNITKNGVQIHKYLLVPRNSLHLDKKHQNGLDKNLQVVQAAAYMC